MENLQSTDVESLRFFANEINPILAANLGSYGMYLPTETFRDPSGTTETAYHKFSVFSLRNGFVDVKIDNEKISLSGAGDFEMSEKHSLSELEFAQFIADMMSPNSFKEFIHSSDVDPEGSFFYTQSDDEPEQPQAQAQQEDDDEEHDEMFIDEDGTVTYIDWD